METFIKIAQFFVSLSIIVLLHEFGHYITARMFKTRVEKFYLFFDFLFPFPNLMNFALFKKKIGDTEYGLGWFPLGGYVKIAGMIDESMDEEFLKSEPQPWEFRSKKPWQRLIIMLGGIIVNILLAFVIYSQLLYWYGEKYVPAENAVYGYAIDSTAQKAGLQYGDKILSYDGGKKFSSADRLPYDMLVNMAKTVEIERNGQKQTLSIPKSMYKELLQATHRTEFVSPLFPCVVDSALPEKPYAKGGGKKGDKIIGIDTISTPYFYDFHKAIEQFKNKNTYVTALRGRDTVRINVAIGDTALVGFAPMGLDSFFKIEEKNYSFFQSIPAGVGKTYTQLVDYVKQFRIVFDPELKGYKQLGSFITMTKQMKPKWDWLNLWSFTAFLSIALAFVNVLPIPGLDGGHALFTVYEMIAGKAPSDKFLERAQIIGMIIIFGLMFFAIGNDILRNFFSGH